MWPPSSAEPPLSARLARITIASAFQRINAARRCSIARSPGKGGWSSSAIVLTYGVTIDGCQCTWRRRAWASRASRRKRARAGPCARITASSASHHSAVSAGSRSMPARSRAITRPRCKERSVIAAILPKPALPAPVSPRRRRSAQVERDLEHQPRRAEQIDLRRQFARDLPADPAGGARREAVDVERHLVRVGALVAPEHARRPVEEERLADPVVDPLTGEHIGAGLVERIPEVGCAHQEAVG